MRKVGWRKVNQVTAAFMLLAFGTVLWALSGCTVLNKAGEFVSENPLVADIAMEQAVSRYIEAGEDNAEQRRRARAVQDHLAQAQQYLQGNPEATASQVISVVEDSIDWESLSRSDRLMVNRIMRAGQVRLEQLQTEGELSPDARLAIRSLLEVAVQTARLFL